MSTTTHPNHMRNRIAMANRLAARVEALAATTNRTVGDVVSDLLTVDADASASFFNTLADITGERRPSEATVSATLAILVERS